MRSLYPLKDYKIKDDSNETLHFGETQQHFLQKPKKKANQTLNVTSREMSNSILFKSIRQNSIASQFENKTVLAHLKRMDILRK
jgi:hypothetical protein